MMTGGWIYAAAVAWVLFGLVIANTRRDLNRPIALLAGGPAIVVLLMPALAGG